MLALFLACTLDTPLPSPEVAAEAQRRLLEDRALEGRRDDLKRWERQQLAARATEALASGDLAAAAQAVAAGRTEDPAGFASLDEALRTAATTAPPEVQAAVWAALYEAATTPAERVQLRRATTDALVRARYADADEVALTRREQAGVTRERAHAALAALRAEYVTPLDDRVLLDAAARRIALLAGLGTPPSIDAGPFDDAFDGLLDQAVELSLSEETAAAELTEAVFSEVDPWSSPIWPAQIAAWERHHDGVQSGVVGIQADDLDGRAVVRTLVEGGSAWASGVHQGDVFAEVRHDRGTVKLREPTERAAEKAASALRGADGTAVTVVFERDGAERTFTLPRGTIPERTVFGWARSGAGWTTTVAPGIDYVHVASFRPHTLGELDAVLPASATRIVLDLRGNGGGDLSVAAALIDRFVASGPMLVLEGRLTGDAEVDAQLLAKRAEGTLASPGGPWEDAELVVLVDSASASSAEVVAGGLQQAANAWVVGDRTAGKGVSQVLRVDEAHGIALQFTNLAWGLPDGTRIHRSDASTSWGIAPDEVLVLSPTERFVVGVMQARREALAVHADGTPMVYTGPEVDPGVPELGGDPQIQAALRHFAPEP
ncbi:MAG: S41 family peptidase [Myxococcota bacterium]